ncbi:protein translocase subunit, partial [Coemansia sp. RSA 2708]
MSSSGFSLDQLSGNGSLSKDDVMQQVKSELAMANAQELISNINKHCFKLCVPRPGSSLSSSEQDSLGRCVDKYLASWDTVSRAYVAK